MMTPLDPIVAKLATVFERVSLAVPPAPSAQMEARLIGDYYLTLPARLPYARRLVSGAYEPELTGLIRTLLVPGMTFVDAGANVGYYTMIAAQLVGETGQVYAFEPETEVYAFLELNVARNGARNVHLTQMAVADRRGTAQFWSSALDRGSLSSLPTPGSSSVMVEAVSLDAFFGEREWPSVDLIKIDVEGAEASVLAGMKELSSRNEALQVIMEINPDAMRRAGTTHAGISHLLSQLGFGFGYIVEQSLRPVSLRDALPRSGLVYNVLASKYEQ